MIERSKLPEMRLHWLVQVSFGLRSRGASTPLRLFVLLVAAIGLLGNSLGCRQRAITELYIEDMARRNRALEDLVYDFDAENRAMEFELEDLRRTNAQLQGRLQELQKLRTQDPASLPSRSRTIAPDSKSPSPVSPSRPIPPERSSPDRIPSGASGTPAPLKLPTKPNNLGNAEEIKLDPPEVVVPKKSDPSIVPEPVLPSPSPLRDEPLPSGDLPKLKNPPAGSGTTPLNPPTEEILPNSPAPGPAPGKSSLLKPAPKGLPTDDTEAFKSDRKILLPGQGNPPGSDNPAPIIPEPNLPVTNASATMPIERTSKGAALRDRRVREIDWHPVLCRAQNTDDQPGDDGLYLVLMPRNSAGQFVPELGELTLVAEETLSDGTVERIGRWAFTAEELKDHMETIGSAPGLHIPVRWTERKPTTSEVVVYAKYALADGTTMVNRRAIPLRRIAAGGSNWTPR